MTEAVVAACPDCAGFQTATAHTTPGACDTCQGTGLVLHIHGVEDRNDEVFYGESIDHPVPPAGDDPADGPPPDWEEYIEEWAEGWP